MILSRNWLNEFVDLKDITDKEFNDEMTLSGSKVETIERPDENLKNVVVGKILEMKRHENSDHMWVCQIDVGQAEPVQIVTGAWNVHVGDYVPAALHGAHLPGGVKIEKGELRGVESNGMLCSPKELGMTAEHDFPYAVITPAAILNDYHPIDKDKPSIPADIKPGDKVYGPVVAARVLECAPLGDGTFHTCLDLGNATAVPDTRCSNLHEGDLVAYNTKSDTICTLEDLHAEQKEFPHCIADGIFVLQEEDAEPGLNMAHILGFETRCSISRSRRTAPTAFPSSALPARRARRSSAPLSCTRPSRTAAAAASRKSSTLTLRTATSARATPRAW